MAVDPNSLETPERGQVRQTRAGGKPSPVVDELTRLRQRVVELRNQQSIHALPGAHQHCFDCFQRGVTAAIDAIEKDEDPTT